MSNSKIDKKDYLIFAVFSGIFVFLGWIAFLSAIGGFFYSWLFGGFFLLMLAVIVRQFILKKIFFEISREFSIACGIILVFAAVSSFFVTPTIFGGRDQGSLSEAAIRLAQNHTLEFSTPASSVFFKIYGPGKAFNFPGFYYTSGGNLVTQFPIAYISWLAIFYSFFGIAGLIAANAVLLFIFLASFYLLARNFLETRWSSILLILIATSFPVFWFFKFTLSENMALAFLWLSVLWAYLFIKEQRLFFYTSFLASMGLLVFTRIEGIFLLISGFLAICLFTRKNPIWKERKKFIVIYPAIFLVILLLTNFSADIYFYKEMAKAMLHIGKDETAPPSVVNNFFSPILSEFRVFSLYGILNFLLLGIFGIAYFWIKKQWKMLIPLFVIAPSLIYLINPWISSDHPWMLRRFVFSIVPVFVFYSVVFLNVWIKDGKFRYKKIISYLACASFLAANLFLFINYFPFSENKDVLQQTKKISDNFQNNDLVLVDREVSGDGFSLLSGPMNFLYNKDAVYFFNPEDLGRIDRSKFSKIYLIAPDKNIELYSGIIGKENISSAKNYSIETERLIGSLKNDASILPIKEKIDITGKIFEIK